MKGQTLRSRRGSHRYGGQNKRCSESMGWKAPAPPVVGWHRSGWTNQSVQMEEISTVGIDLAKSVFQIHAIDSIGKVVVRRQLHRQQMLKFFEQLPPCLVGMEACGTAHYWARELSALGHDVRLMPPAYVKPYVK
jgi:hypothetical protein